ncbi:MAG: hypothetical protein ACRCU2_27760, partial [Planktothrix sp.]
PSIPSKLSNFYFYRLRLLTTEQTGNELEREREHNQTLSEIAKIQASTQPIQSVEVKTMSTSSNYSPRVSGDVHGVVVGGENITGVAGGDIGNIIQGDGNIVEAVEGQVTAKQVAELLTDLERRIQSLEGLPESEKKKSIQRLGAAKAEAEEEEPNKESIAIQLKRVNETLTQAGETSQGIKEFIKEVAPTLVKIARWLGYAIGSI